MENSMNHETEMKKIFRILSLENQADLLIRARQFHIDQKEMKNEETPVSDGGIGMHIGICRKNGSCSDDQS